MTVVDAERDDDVVAPASPPARLYERLTPAMIVVIGIVVLYTGYYTQRSLNVHHALGTSTYDSALYDQGVWLVSRFETPFVTLMGRNLFGDHSSFILIFLVPFYWLWPSAGVLFFSQSLAIGAGAIPVFLYARKRLDSEWAGVALSGAYLLHPAIGGTNLENFHPDSFLGVFVGMALWAALERRWRTYVLFVVLALSVKEDASLVLVPLGVWVAVQRDRKIGLLTVFGSLAFMAFAMFVVMRSLIGVPTRNGWRIPFGGPSGVIDTAITNPTSLIRYLRSEDRPWYLVQMTAPFAWLFARLPWVAMISGLVLFTNILSTFFYQYQVEFHYSLVAVPALSLGTVHALGELKKRRTIGLHPATGATALTIPPRMMGVATVCVAALFTSYLWSPVPWGRNPGWMGDPSNPWASSARQIIADIPPDAVVSAHYRITPHIAHRTEIYQFPTPFRAVLYGPNGNVDGPRIPNRAERVEFVVLSTNINDYSHADWLLIESAFALVDVNDHWLLYERLPDVALPAEQLTP